VNCVSSDNDAQEARSNMIVGIKYSCDYIGLGYSVSRKEGLVMFTVSRPKDAKSLKKRDQNHLCDKVPGRLH
jgi:hypothetical protein